MNRRRRRDLTEEPRTETPSADLEPPNQRSGPDPTDAESAESESAESETPEISTERVVEAILFASDEPLTPAKIVSILGTGSAREVRKIIQTLNAGYTEAGHAFRIEEIAGGYQMLTLPEYNTWLRRLRQSRQDSRLTPGGHGDAGGHRLQTARRPRRDRGGSRRVRRRGP